MTTLSSEIISLETIIKNLEDYLKQVNYVSKSFKEILELLKSYYDDSLKNNFPGLKTSMIKTDNKFENLKSKSNSINPEHIIKIINDWAIQEKSGFNKKNEEYIEKFIYDLQKYLTDFGFNFKGHLPNFQTRNIKIKTDSKKFKISLLYGGDEEKLLEIKVLDGKTVALEIKSFYDFISKIDLQNELNSIFDAYSNVIKELDKNLGDWCPIIQVMDKYISLTGSKELEKELRPYNSRIIFSFILYKILQSNMIANQKYRLNKKTAIHGAASKKEEHLWLPITNEDVQGENAMYLNFLEA